MQDDVEVLFCELCGTSVPLADMSVGAAIRHQGKVVGACCLVGLRASAAEPAKPASAPPPSAPARAAGSEVRLLPVAVATLAAIAAATIFLDHRLSTAEENWRQDRSRMLEAQASDSQVLAALAVAMDAVPRRSDLDALQAKVTQLEGSAGEARLEAKKLHEITRLDVAALAQEQRNQAAQAVDYRPLIDDLRQRQQRVFEVVSALRTAPAAEPTPVAHPSAPDAPADASAGPALPAALAEHVKKLTSADAAVRFEAVDELLKSKDPATMVHLLPLARDPDSFVRRLTVEGLAQWKRPEVVEALLVALTDADEYVRETSWRALKEVTGQKIAFESSGTKDARARAVQRWQDWWDKNKGSFGS